RLKADNQNRVARVADIVLQMMDDAAAFTHATRGDQHAWLITLIEVLTLVHGMDIANQRLSNKIGRVLKEFRIFFVEALGMQAENFGRGHRKRTIDNDGYVAKFV